MVRSVLRGTIIVDVKGIAMSLIPNDVGTLNAHLFMVKQSLQRAPKSQTVTDALATVEIIATMFGTSQQYPGDALAAKALIDAAIHKLADVKVPSGAKVVPAGGTIPNITMETPASVLSAIQQFREVVDVLRIAEPPTRSDVQSILSRAIDLLGDDAPMTKEEVRRVLRIEQGRSDPHMKNRAQVLTDAAKRVCAQHPLAGALMRVAVDLANGPR